jgi:hypothetical protein
MNNTLNTPVVSTQYSITCKNNTDLAELGCVTGCMATICCMLKSTDPKLLISDLIINSVCGLCLGAVVNKVIENRTIITIETKPLTVTQQPYGKKGIV